MAAGQGQAAAPGVQKMKASERAEALGLPLSCFRFCSSGFSPGPAQGPQGLLGWDTHPQGHHRWECHQYRDTSGTGTPPAGTPQFLMDMSRDAFDDQYEGCTEAMEAAGPALLEQEQARGRSRLFSRVWARAGERWQQVKGSLAARLPPGFKDEYGQAVIAYTDNSLHYFFNTAMRAAGRSRATYNASFPFKALHFYLTRALQLLRGPCETTYRTPVYRGIAHTRYQLQGASPFRFGSFASSSFRREQAESFGQDTFLSIRSCFGVPIHAFSLYTEEEEVLIPGHEIFWVFPDEGSHRFVLRSTNRTCSHFNCAFLGYEKSLECRGSTGRNPPQVP
ncbi:ecto-ADP-ribosyltransferase 5 isoform X2 [Oxyura jamaicensis]|uniref:ecto-ADP-ribosyltransferase 5 isoform X2 n=1 Tax=Oxyura jamaicensis TaxID=8884 RepID=UPI0015A50B50|nr:ecto-ADP-ribosyltransferase 5 isoform X2 [Oxyura jamaicensis]